MEPTDSAAMIHRWKNRHHRCVDHSSLSATEVQRQHLHQAFGFEWVLSHSSWISTNVNNLEWEQNFAKLKIYLGGPRALNVPRSHPSLGNFVINQRAGNRTGKLIDERRIKLDGFGFVYTKKK